MHSVVIDKIVSLIGLSISFVGIAIILVTTIRALYDFVKLMLGGDIGISDIRLELGYGIILGLEFFVAADIIESVFKPTYYDIGILAAIVAIRTFLSYFLNKELEDLHVHKQLGEPDPLSKRA
ncbi:DUF1622 domain-containing protein [Candidatus Dependentiae bacterium]|nr:DUF1622 domain-containing protein [Candidatus Dependentiae bacterium]